METAKLSADDCELELVVYAGTPEERDSGWLVGPYARDECGLYHCVSGFRQGAKTRDITILPNSGRLWLFRKW